jgi:hypothetical protein
MRFIEFIKDRIQGRAAKGEKRSEQWPEVRNTFLKENPSCAVCGGTKRLQVHHIVPFNVAPDLELEKDNLITLCTSKKYGINCHLLIGHLGNFKRANLNVKADAAYWKERLR